MNRPTIVGAICTLFIVAAVILFITDKKVEKNEFREIAVNEVSSIGKNRSEFIYIFSEECAACGIYKPILKNAIVETDAVVYQMDFLSEKNKEFLSEKNVDSVPILFEIKNGKIVNRYEGAREISETINILK